MKAMILTAGLGTRLLPLTKKWPKPLFRVGDRPVLDYLFELLKEYGFKEVTLNLHHLGELIEREVGDGSAMGLKVTYSRERELMGTGGGVKTASDLWKDEEVLVINGDNIIDLNLEKLIRVHRARDATATMAVRPGAADAAYTPIHLDRNNMVASIGGEADNSAHIFIGAQILTPRFIKRLPAGKPSCLINHGYRKALKNCDGIAAMITTGYWREISTPDLYWRANLDFLKARLPAHFYRGREDFIRRGISAGKGCEFGHRTRFYYPVYIGDDCRVGRDCVLGPSALLGKGAAVGDDCAVENAVLWPGMKVRRGARLRDTIVTPHGKVKIKPRED